MVKVCYPYIYFQLTRNKKEEKNRKKEIKNKNYFAENKSISKYQLQSPQRI